jgi:uncharacterized membrane protein YhaH (DUF805 family)
MDLKKDLFEGKLSRGKYFFYTLQIWIIVYFLFTFIKTNNGYLDVLFNSVGLIIIVIFLSLTTKRLNDSGASPWFSLLLFIIPLSPLVILYSLLKPSK